MCQGWICEQNLGHPLLKYIYDITYLQQDLPSLSVSQTTLCEWSPFVIFCKNVSQLALGLSLQVAQHHADT